MEYELKTRQESLIAEFNVLVAEKQKTLSRLKDIETRQVQLQGAYKEVVDLMACKRPASGNENGIMQARPSTKKTEEAPAKVQ